jgi:hypothetical protein
VVWKVFPLHPSYHHLESEQIKVEGMDMSEVDGTNMVEEHGHPTNHRLGEEGMNTVDEHNHLTNHRLLEKDLNMMDIHMMEVESMYMVKERPTNYRPKVKDIDREIEIWLR